MPKFRPKYKEIIAINPHGEWHVETPDGRVFTECLDGSDDRSFRNLWEEIPAEEASPDPDPLNRIRIRTVFLDMRGGRDCWCSSDDQPGDGHHDDRCWDVQNAVKGNGDSPPYNFDRDESGLLLKAEEAHDET